MPERLLPAREPAREQLDDDQRRAHDGECEVEAELLVATEDAEMALDDDAVEAQEVDPGDEHEDQQHVLGDRREHGGGLVAGREAAERDHGERMRDRVIERHRRVEAGPAERRQHDNGADGEADVERPQPPRRLADRLAEALDIGRARELGLQQLAAADPQPGQHRDGQDDDAHAAEPGLNWRQNSIERLRPSTSVATVAPVAVKPDTDSK